MLDSITYKRLNEESEKTTKNIMDTEKLQLTLNEHHVDILSEDVQLPIEMTDYVQSDVAPVITVSNSEGNLSNSHDIEKSASEEEPERPDDENNPDKENVAEETDKITSPNTNLEEDASFVKNKNMLIAGRYVKLTLLIFCWMFIMFVYIDRNVNLTETKYTTVMPGVSKTLIFKLPSETSGILIEVTGPLITEYSERELNASEVERRQRVDVWVERWLVTHKDQKKQNVSEKWTIFLQDDLDFITGVTRTKIFKLDPTKLQQKGTEVYSAKLQSNAKIATPLIVKYSRNSIDIATGTLYAVILLCVFYVIIAFDLMNRAMAAMVMSSLSLTVLSLVSCWPSLAELTFWMDIETLLLLFSIMIIVAVNSVTGWFDVLTSFFYRVLRGKTWAILTFLFLMTFACSMANNLAAIVMITPLAIRLCEVADIQTVPILIGLMMYSNLLGLPSITSSPPNIIIATNDAVTQSGIVNDLCIHMLPGLVLVLIQTTLQLRYMHIGSLKKANTKAVKDIRTAMALLSRLAELFPNIRNKEEIINMALHNNIRKRLDQLRESNETPEDDFQNKLKVAQSKIIAYNKVLLLNICVVAGPALWIGIFYSIDMLDRVSVAYVFFLCTLLLLIVIDVDDLQPVLRKVDWSTLMLYAGLMVFSQVLCKLGLIDYISNGIESALAEVGSRNRLPLAILLVLWVSGVASAIINNVPLTTRMVGVVTSLSSNHTLQLPMAPLMWALFFGASLGGNGTLLASSSNMVHMGVADRYGYKINFIKFLKIGIPVMFGNLVVITGYLFLCHCVFVWH